MSHNPVGPHGLLQGQLYLFFYLTEKGRRYRTHIDSLFIGKQLLGWKWTSTYTGHFDPLGCITTIVLHKE
jgi:hypothetical protein